MNPDEERRRINEIWRQRDRDSDAAARMRAAERESQLVARQLEIAAHQRRRASASSRASAYGGGPFERELRHLHKEKANLLERFERLDVLRPYRSRVEQVEIDAPAAERQLKTVLAELEAELTYAPEADHSTLKYVCSGVMVLASYCKVYQVKIRGNR